MDKEKSKGKQKKRSALKTVSLGTFAVLMVILVIVSWSIDTLVKKKINEALDTYLPEGGRLEAVDIGLIRGRVECKDLLINPPWGYGKDVLLSLASLRVDVDMSSILGDEIVVEELALKGLSLSLIRDKEGRLNLVRLISSIQEAPAKDALMPEPKEASGENDDGEEEPASVPAIRIRSIRFENLAVRFNDRLTGDEWSAGLTINLDIDDLYFRDLLNREIMVGRTKLALSDINVDQPEGFGEVPLMAINRIEVETPGYEIGGSRLAVKTILIDGFAASFERDRNGALNLIRLLETLPGNTEGEAEKRSTQGLEEKKGASSSGGRMPVICLERVEMRDGSFHYRDQALTKETLTFPLNSIKLDVVQLCLFENMESADPASASMSFELKQPGKLPVAYFGSVARIGSVGRGVPHVNSQVRLTGFKLDTLGSLVPHATSTALGAAGLDAALAMALDDKRIKLAASATSDRNINYKGIHIQGPLGGPKVEMGQIMAGVYNRVSDGLINIGASGLDAGVGIAKGGVGAAEEVGSGIFKVGKNIGENLLKAGTGLFSMDQKQVREGLIGSTKGSADLTLDSVEGAGSLAGDGLRGSVSKLKGDAALEAWDKGIPSRFKKAMTQAEKALAEMSYPPVTN